MTPRIEPPEPPACASTDPDLFDNEWTYQAALKVCGECQVRSWCLQTVDPARHYYDGVVGGAVWREGRPVDSYTDVAQDDTVMRYIHSLRRNRQLEVDMDKVRDFLVGKLPINRMNMAERAKAAEIMRDRDIPAAQAMTWTKLAAYEINAIYAKTGNKE